MKIVKNLKTCKNYENFENCFGGNTNNQMRIKPNQRRIGPDINTSLLSSAICGPDSRFVVEGISKPLIPRLS